MNFQIETTSLCNLTCVECPNHEMQRKREFMSMEVWDTILRDYVLPYKDVNSICPPTVIPHKDGEPLLNRKLPDMLKTISDLDSSLHVDIYSHGLLLPKLKYDFIGMLASLRNKVRLLVSFHFHNFDGTKNDYAETVLYFVRLFEGGVIPSNVELIFASHIVAPETQSTLDAWKESWRRFVDQKKVTVHSNASINPWTGRIDDPNVMKFDCCPYDAFFSMFFGVTGNVIACCMDLEEEIVFGNVMEDDPDEMFSVVDKFHAEQRRIKQEKTGLKHEVCRNCFGMGVRQDVGFDLNLVSLGTKM